MPAGSTGIRNKRGPCKHTGLTLPELVVTLAVVSVLTVAATDGLPRFIQSNRMAGEINAFVTALQLARSEAVKHRRRVVLCPSSDGQQCANSSQWKQGWILFASDNRERETSEPLLQSGNPLGAGILMRSGNYRKRIVYQPDGSSGGSNSSFTFCDQRQRAEPRVICLSNTGRPRLTQTRCDGRPITCP
jgi:type IV fimbrial biogenesis protein FimT